MANLAGTYSSSRSYYPYLDYTISAYEYSRTASTVTYRCSATVSIASSGGYGFDIYLNYNIGGATGSKTLKTTSGGFPSSTGSFDVTVSGVSAAGGTNTVSASMWSSSSNDSTHWQNSFNTGTRYLDTSSFNRPPVINSVTLSGISEGNTIWENTSSVTVNYSSSDPDGNISSYEIIRYVNNASNATFSSTTGSYKDSTISSVAAGATVKYRVRAKDAYNEWSSEKWSPSFKINSLTGAKLTSSNPGISWQSTSMVFSYSGASNTNGDGNFKYHFLNDAGIPIYNNTPKSSFANNQIDIDGWGITNSERACIKSSDLINFVKSTTNRTKTFNLTLRTTNSAGTYKDSVITVTVSLKPNPAALSISALAGTVTAAGIERYVPNVGGVYTLSWGASSDLTGGSGLSYEVQANFNNGGWYVVQSLIQGTSVDISSDVKRYSITSAAATYKLRVRAYTVYGTETLSAEKSYTLDYWYAPTISIGKINRLNGSYNAPITANVNSSFATITTANWSGNGASGNLTKAADNKTATGTASQNISATTSFTLTATIVDNSGLTGATQTDKQTVPRYQPIISMRSLGLGVNAYADANYIFKVGGAAMFDDIVVNGGISKRLRLKQGFDIHSAASGSGSSGFLKIARVTIAANYQNAPIKFTIAQRGRGQQVELTLTFVNTTGVTPSISSFLKSNDDISAFIYAVGDGNYDIYVQKSESYDRIDVVDFNMGQYMGGTQVTFTDEFVSAVPSGSLTAGKAVNLSASDVGAIPTGGDAGSVNGRIFNWSWGGIPTHIWGSEGDSTNQKVYSPANLANAIISVVGDAGNLSIRYANGTQINAMVVTRTININTVWGSMFTSNPITNLPNYVEAFAAAPAISYACSGNGYLAYIGGGTAYPTSTHPGNIELMRATAASGAFKIQIISVGRWK